MVDQLKSSLAAASRKPSVLMLCGLPVSLTIGMQQSLSGHSF
jgi:hypothetical protein